MEQQGSGRPSPRRRRGFLAGIAADLAEFAETVGNVVSSAGELLLDNELRKKGANLIAQEASKTINEAQRGIEAGARARIGAGAQKLQSVLRNIERQIQEFQRQQQQRDLQAELEHHQKLPVDIQIGDQVYEDMPQEMRTRFWYVLLERPDLVQGLTRRGQVPSRPGSALLTTAGTGPSNQGGSQSSAPAAATTTAAAAPPAAADAGSQAEAASRFSADAAAAAVGATIGADADPCGSHEQLAADDDATANSEPATAAAPSALHGEHSVHAAVPAGGTPFAAYSSSPGPAAANAATGDAAAASGAAEAAAAGQGSSGVPVGYQATEDAPDIDDLLAQQSTDTLQEPMPAAAAAAAAADSSSTDDVGGNASATAGSNGNCTALGSVGTVPSAPSPWLSLHTPSSCNSSSDSPRRPAAPNPCTQLQPAAAAAAGTAATAAAAGTAATAAAAGTAATAAAASGGSAVAVTSPGVGGEAGDGWEMVPEDVPSELLAVPGSHADLDVLQSLVERLSQASLDASRACQASVFRAMLHEVPWMPGEGIPQDIDPHGEYAQLLAAGCGGVEDLIARDVPRTFPEHPLFTTQEGQQRLLRLLKAYATADPEVGYCQGMAFPAGILLMYMPEEHAFRLFRRMMTSGPTLRRLYLPGLEFLKLELSRFELLLSTYAPQLHQHLLDAGLPALLYSAQWLMTCYACPFPIHVAARVIDVLLQSEDDAVLLRLGLAVMGALQQGLLELDDFEALMIHLKVKPLSWPMHIHRMVLNEALHSPASDAELAAATAAVQAEFARLGRFSSFSSHQLAAQPLQGQQAAADGADSNSIGGANGSSGMRLELVTGTLGPRTQASAAALEAAEAAAAAGAGGGSCTSSIGKGLEAPRQEQQQRAAAGLEGSTTGIMQQQEQQHGPDSSGRSATAVLGELDAALIGLIQDMDIILPAESAGDGLLQQQRR